jgi:hypothetical protein
MSKIQDSAFSDEAIQNTVCTQTRKSQQSADQIKTIQSAGGQTKWSLCGIILIWDRLIIV